jgi:hypothetical protein
MTEYKDEQSGLWLVSHPQWIRILGWIMIPVIAVCGLYVMAIPVIESRYDITLIVSCLFFAGGQFYMCFISFKVFPFLRSDIKFGEKGFTVYKPNGSVQHYEWDDVAKLKHHSSVQVLVLKDNGSRTILAITEQAHSYHQFVDLSTQKTGLKY